MNHSTKLGFCQQHAATVRLTQVAFPLSGGSYQLIAGLPIDKWKQELPASPHQTDGETPTRDAEGCRFGPLPEGLAPGSRRREPNKTHKGGLPMGNSILQQKSEERKCRTIASIEYTLERTRWPRGLQALLGGSL